MIKLSTKGRYALRAIVDLADKAQKQKSNVSLKEIAARQNVSIKYLEALFTILKNAGLIKSQRGAKGGYLLAKSPRTIAPGQMPEYSPISTSPIT